MKVVITQREHEISFDAFNPLHFQMNFNLIKTDIVSSSVNNIGDVYVGHKQCIIQKCFKLYLWKYMKKVESGKDFAVFSIKLAFVMKFKLLQ